MKDAYSFHANSECLAAEYKNMFDTYHRIFNRLGLKFRAVEADNGSIGGSSSHEFHVLAESGEDLIAHCSGCSYAANVEKAMAIPHVFQGTAGELTEVSTPNKTAVEDVASFLNVANESLLKTLIFKVSGGELDGQTIAACVRGDDQLQDVKLTRVLGATEIEMASDEDVKSIGGIVGYVGPVGLSCPVYIDSAIKNAEGMIMGSNKADTHTAGVSINRDVPNAIIADLRQTQANDTCFSCHGFMELSRGIEVGHIFELGTVYSQPMEVMFQDENGKRAVATMGCYGIGVSRLMAAVVEQCNDEKGIAWPLNIAPFDVSVVSVGKNEAVAEAAANIYNDLIKAGVNALFDDRNERPGVKFKDAELMGIPLTIVVGDRGLESDALELKPRLGEATESSLAGINQAALDMLATIAAKESN